MKFGFVSLGCCKNLVDSEKIMGLLVSNNHEIVNDPSSADVIIVNTCGFIESAKEESINTILEMSEYGKRLIVMGCMAQRYRDELVKALPEIDCIITLDDYAELTKHLSEFLNLKLVNEYGKTNRVLATKPWLGYLKIGDGCSNNCTYCAIPLIRGKYRSFKIEDLVLEAKGLKDSGVKELVVIAQDTTKYGIDLYGKLALLDLLKELEKLDFKWIRVLYMYPDEITDELVTGMKELKSVIPYFDIPVQYGNDEILKLMNRRGSVESIKNTVKLIKDTFEMPVLRTTIIVGFPNETREHFDDTLKFVKDIKWDRLGAFTYSKEEDTAAYNMENEVDQDIKDARLKELMDIQEEIVIENTSKLIGKTLDVIVENYDGLTSRYLGRSIFSAPDGIDGVVFINSEEKLEIGEFYPVKINKIRRHDLLGEYIKEN